MGTTELAEGRVVLHGADCRDVLRGLADNSIDSVVTDPPYALVSIVKRFGKPGSAPANGDVYNRSARGFMGKTWDTGEVAFAVEFWAEVLRVLKPGGHVVAFSGTRTYHRMAVAIEDAGFEIRDQLGWLYGSGFPKSHDVQKAIQKAKGKSGVDSDGNPIWCESCGEAHATLSPIGEALLCNECAASEWEGWGSALKPAWEPICLARKSLIGTMAENILAHGVGGLNIQGCRVGDELLPEMKAGQAKLGTFERQDMVTPERIGRWPANVVHDGSDEVVGAFPDAPGQQRAVGPEHGEKASRGIYGDFGARDHFAPRTDATKSAARFFYCAKANRSDRDEGLDAFEKKRTGGMSATADGSMLTGSGNERTTSRANTHPTVKPTSLMQWLCRLVTPPGGVILDPFMGSGSTGKAAVWEGFSFIGCEREAEYIPIADARIRYAVENPPGKREGKKAAAFVPANDNVPVVQQLAPDLFSEVATNG
jgi:site-specific DNA-methyltransferase (adenine-specific)